jgi:two-component system, chemotaxis family, sensor kinase Cph1
MKDFIDFLSDLFTTELWPARWHCGFWSDFHGWLYISSDLMIWFAYFAIPVIILTYTSTKKYELKYTKTYFLFASFILLCGATHLLDALMFWIPMYRFNALIRFITGVTSLFTVFHLIKILPYAYREKTSMVLEREIAKRLEAERRLENANEGLRSFAYMASHDLQEPVRKMKMYTSQILELNEGNLDPQTLKLLNKAQLASERMSQIIEGILSLSSIQSNVDVKKVDLAEVVAQAVNDLEEKIKETHALVNVGQLPVVSGNYEYLVQLFYNLVGNAIKFSKENPRVNIVAEVQSSSVLIHVKDNGIGMEEEETKKIFTAFERLHSRKDFEGSGIGLAICKKIVDAHNGDILVQSKPGLGTVFTVKLPI